MCLIFYFQVIECITNGHLLDIPCNCPEEVTKLMMNCWKRQPQERMPMKILNNHLNRLCLTHPEYVDLSCRIRDDSVVKSVDDSVVKSVKVDCAQNDTFV